MKKISSFIIIFIFITVSLYSKSLDQAFSDIFSKLIKQFSYEGVVVALIPERDEVAVQFENNFIPPIGAEVTIYRHKKKLFNQLTGKFIGYLNEHVGTITIQDKVGTVALGEIVENNGHIRVGDNARFTKRVIIYVKSISNLTDKPTAAYDVKSYIELAAGKFRTIQIVFPPNPILQQKKNIYPVNMKVFIKDSISSSKKDLSVEFSSVYTGRNIGIYTEAFDLSKKMLTYKPPAIKPVTPASPSIMAQPGVLSYPGLPTYPMGPTSNIQPQGQLPAYPMNPTGVPQQSFNKPVELKPIRPVHTIKTQPKLKSFSEIENFQPVVTDIKTISEIPEKLKSIDFYGNKIIFTDGKKIVYAEFFGEHGMRKLSQIIYKGPGQIMNVSFVDINGDGFKDGVVNIISKYRMLSQLYKIVNNKLVFYKGNLNYILGGFDFDNDGIEELAGQTYSSSDIFGDSLYELEVKNGKIIRKKRVWIPAGFRLISSIKADIDGDGKKELIFINAQHKLIIYKNGENIYSGSKSLGGSNNKILLNIASKPKTIVIDPRPIILKKNLKGKEKILVVKNFLESGNGEVEIASVSNGGDIIIEPYSGKVKGAIDGITVYNGELVCGVARKKSSYLIAFLPY